MTTPVLTVWINQDEHRIALEPAVFEALLRYHQRLVELQRNEATP